MLDRVPAWPAGQPAVPTALQRPSAPPHSYGGTPAVVSHVHTPKTSRYVPITSYLFIG